MSSPSLYTLPVELIYHLFEYLDISTILFSFRYVCKRFQTIVNLFDQYKLDMRLISKYDFDHVCHVISPEKILSIILSNDINTPHQIRTFLSQFSFDQFTRLQSLNLNKIEENNLFSVLMHMSKCSLQSLTIHCSAWDTFSYTIRVLLSSTIAKSNLEKLHLNISYRDLDMISWPPLPITLKYLSLQRCTFQEYCMILRHTINLHKLILTECLMYNSDETKFIYQPTDTIYPSKLHSLSFGACFMRMKELLIFLSCTPTLNHIKLIIWTDSSDSVMDGSKWQHFISNKLPLLNKFEFFFDDLTHINRNSINLQSYIHSFQTSFWTEINHWYVACDYIKTLSVVRLYSLPICNSLFIYYTNSERISSSTLTIPNNQSVLTHQVHELNLNLNETMEADDDDEIQNNQLSTPIFCRVTRLSLSLDGRYPYTSLRLLRTILDLSSLVRLSIQILIHSIAQNALLIDYMSSILKETSNLHTLKITYIHIEEHFINTQILCSIIPRSVKHLQISITNFDEMKSILERLDQLLSVTFYSPNLSNYYEDIKKWMQLKRKNSLYREGLRCIQIWLGMLVNNDNEKHSMKRVLQRFRLRQAS